MTGSDFRDLIAAYLCRRYGDRGLTVYTEVRLGKTIIGKNRRIDILAMCGEKALGLECKYQESPGTADEKIPYALDDLRALPLPGYLVYAGGGFSKGILHMLAGSPLASYCLPTETSQPGSEETRELDQMLSLVFGWWDLLIVNKKPFAPREGAAT